MKRRSFLRGLFAAPLAPVAAQAVKLLPRPAVASYSKLDLVAFGEVLKQYYKPEFIGALVVSSNPWLKYLKVDRELGVLELEPVADLDVAPRTVGVSLKT